MKIAVINNLLAPHRRGGAEQIAQMQIQGLKDLGHQVFCISSRAYFEKIADNEGHKYIRSLFSNLPRLPLFLRLFWHLGELGSIRKYRQVKKTLAKWQPDLVISHNLLGLGILSYQALSRYKHIHILHDVQLFYPSGLIYRGEEKKADSVWAKIYSDLSRRLAGSPDLVVSPSQWLLDEHKKRNFFAGAETVKLPNPVSDRIPYKEISRPAVYTYVFIGHLSRAKGFDLLLAAWNGWQKSAGGGPARLLVMGALGDVAAENLPGIEYLGFVNEAQLRQTLEECDCLVLPSRVYENAPMAISEALCRGKLVVASRLGGIRDWEGHNLVGLVEPGNAAALKKAMIFAKKTKPTKKGFVKMLNTKEYLTVLLDKINYGTYSG